MADDTPEATPLRSARFAEVFDRREAVEHLYAELKSLDQMRDSETRAAGLLCEILGAATWTPRDVGDAEGMHDFDLEMSDGSKIAVEVTSDTAGADAAFVAALEEIDPVGAPALSGVWFVEVSPPGDHPDDHTKARRRAQETSR